MLMREDWNVRCIECLEAEQVIVSDMLRVKPNWIQIFDILLGLRGRCIKNFLDSPYHFSINSARNAIISTAAEIVSHFSLSMNGDFSSIMQYHFRNI